jgi:hypothetical protein
MIMIDPLYQGVEGPDDRECGALTGPQVGAIRDDLREIMRQIADGAYTNAAARVGQLFAKVDVAGRMAKATERMDREVADLGAPILYKHADGGLYVMTSEIEMKHPVSGDWVPGVLYTDAHPDLRAPFPTMRATTKERWEERFIRLQPPYPPA